MQNLFKTHGTTLTIGLFLVSTISGIFLFFHLWSATFHGMHEWLSMVLLIPVGVHIWRNWAAFARYFKKKTIFLPLAVSLLAGIAFAYPSLTTDQPKGNPLRATISAIENASIQKVAPLYNLSPTELSIRLANKGYIIRSLDIPLKTIAAQSDKSKGRSLVADIAFE